MERSPRERAYQAIGMVLTYRTVARAHGWLYRLVLGRGVTGHALGVPMILITTTGRRSGVERTNPLVAIPDGTGWLIVGSNGGRERLPGWAYNLRAASRATVTYRARSVSVDAREVDGNEYDRRWRQVVAAYPGFAVYQRQTSRRIPIFALEAQPHGKQGPAT